jgi:hypothetical protein
MAIVKIRNKVTEKTAFRWSGRESDMAELFQFMGELTHAPDDPHVETGIGFTPPDGNVFIPTLEGTMTASPGDWIIKGLCGEFYPCKPDIFEKSYEIVEE